jgi:hypothetical protein
MPQESKTAYLVELVRRSVEAEDLRAVQARTAPERLAEERR